MQVTAARRPGRGHRRADRPCQDAFASRELPGRQAVVFAVADGLGSRPLSHIGSEVAAHAAVDRLASEARWDVRAMLRAFRAARRALRLEAADRGVTMDELATTLQVGVLAPGVAVAAMVGDGAMVAGRSRDGAMEDLGPAGASGGAATKGRSTDARGASHGTATGSLTGAVAQDASIAGNGQSSDGGGKSAAVLRVPPNGTAPSPRFTQEVLLAPTSDGYANEVMPLTSRWWRRDFQYAQQEQAEWMLGFTDGLTRLVLARADDAWVPYRPFWDAFVPRLAARPFDVELAHRFLAADNVDASWDDDKCLVAVVHDGTG